MNNSRVDIWIDIWGKLKEKRIGSRADENRFRHPRPLLSSSLRYQQLYKAEPGSMPYGSTKGQLISEWLFDVLNFPENQCKNLIISALESKSGWITKTKAIYYVK